LRVNYFAYDVTINPEVMKRILDRWGGPRRARLEGYRLVFDTYSPSWRGGVAGIREESGSHVIGAIYAVEDEDFSILDRYQGVPTSRSRVKVVVRTDEGLEEAYTYVSAGPRRRVTPSRSYLSLMVRGLKALGYSEAELRFVEKAALS